MKKRIVSMVLALCIILSAMPIQTLAAVIQNTDKAIESEAMQNPFSDVKETDWFYEPVMYALQNGLFEGISDTIFSPQGFMTRAMYVTVMGRIAEINLDDYKGSTEFSDVPVDSWYAPFVKWAKEEGITTGIGSGKFNPDGLITREQMATLIVRFFDAYKIPYPEANVTSTPSDIDSVSDYAKEAVLKFWRCGIFEGSGSGKFNPKQNATRAEAAILSMTIDEVVEKWFIETGRKPAPEEETKEEPQKPNENPQDKPQDKPINPVDHSDDDSGKDVLTYTVTFMDGDKQIERFTVKKGQPLSKTPDNSKTAKEGYIFVGWFTDKGCTTPFYAHDPVISNMIVYAEYEEIVKEELTITSFSLLDQSPDLSFEIQRIGQDAEDVNKSAVLTVMDGSDPVELNIIDNGNDTFTVKAKDGFREGASYKLTLGDGYIFKDKVESIRTANFSIKKEEVDNLMLNDEIIYIKDTDEISYKIGDSDPVDVLKPELLNSDTTEKVTGSFEYEGASEFKENDILCIYETTHPNERDYVNNSYTDDAEVYVEVVSVKGNTVTFKSLDETDAEKIIFMPDTIPFKVAELPEGESGTVQATDVDNEARIEMGLDENPVVEKGDFLVFYIENFADLTDESEVYYAVVTDVNGDTISYQRTTKDEIEKAMDTFLQQTPDGDELLEGVDIQSITDKIEEQVRESGFAEEAAEYLALIATQTKGFQDLSGITDFSITDENGNPLTDEELELMGIGRNIELSDDVDVTVELDSSSKYFKNGIRLAVGISAEFTVDIGEEGQLKIVLSATFVEEISIDITASAHAKVKWIVIVPKFKELTFSSSIDIKNYSAISVDVKMYTVEKEEEGLWEKLKKIKNGKYKETFEEIEELKNKITQAKGTAEEIQGYISDLEKLWASIPSDVTNKEEYEGLLDTLGELNVTQELMEMLNLTSETELDAGVRNLMNRYSEMLENESDWIEILNKEIFSKNIYIKIFAINISADFVIKGNVNIAMGANMEYVVGKRYSFWFDIISKTSGSSEMDLLDEKFAFQFYVMGKLGLKMGIEAEIAVGVISTKIGSIGLTAEFGPYVEMWGYFIYEYTKMRPANTSTWNYDEEMMGAMYLEFGLYLEMTFKAQALDGLFEYQPTLLDKKWPLLTAGTRNNVYGFAYEIADDEVLLVEDYDNNSANGITMTLPETYRQMEYMDLCEGDVEQEIYDLGKFNYTLSNSNFAFNKDNGEITVTVPKGVQYMECDLTLTWKLDKLAFSNYDITVTIPLVWTNLSTEELNERFTASLRAGNARDGYTTIWSKRVMKNQEFDLPTVDEVKAILGVDSYETSEYGSLKYSAINGYGEQQTKGLTILRDQTYYFDVTPRTYTLTVKGVESSNGTKEDREFTSRFGEAFDLSLLANSGTNDDVNRNYTAFLKVVAKDSNGKEILRDVNEPIGRTFAMEILGGTTYTATYVDNSALVTFQFEGIDLEPIKVKMRKGDVASTEFFDEELYARNAIVKSISPAFAPISSPITYTVICEVQEVPVALHTITFDTKGGSDIEPVSYPVGSVIAKPADPTKPGYTFDGWYSDPDLTQVFFFTTMPDEDITIYAKWRANEYIVTFDPNEGTLPEGVEDTKTVVFGEYYGELPVPVKTGSSFRGWYTERTGGQRVTEDTVVDTYKDHTLYAQWGEKATIDESCIVFIPDQEYDYNGEHHEVAYYTTGVENVDFSSFIIKYKRQNFDSSWSDTAINAGIYDVKVVREEDENYDYFEHTYTNVMVINKIEREIDANPTGSSYKANLQVDKLPKDAYPGDGTVLYAISTNGAVPTSGWQDSRVFMNLGAGEYYIFAMVKEGENYFETDVVRSTKPITVKGIDVGNTMKYSLLMKVKTSNIKDAGTDSIISGRIYFLDGTSTQLTHFDNDGDDFERGDLGIYSLEGPDLRVPWMIEKLEIDYQKKGTKPGWHCEYVQPYVSKINLAFQRKFVNGEEVPVNQWFGAEENDRDHVVWIGETDSMKRVIQKVGNFESIIENMFLSSSDTDSYTFTYDGLVMDQYGGDFESLIGKFVPGPYNAYDYLDAPTLSITSGDEEYDDCIDYRVNSFSIDKAALYEAMMAKGDTEIELTVILQFPERSTTSDTATWIRTITVRIAD